jgi:tetratricopeptide (TPR) repeat protein
MSSRPDDAALAAKVLDAAVNLREPQGAIELSQRAVVLTEEAPSALRRHAALLFAAGTVEESLGVLFYLEERYGPWALDPASIALLAGCHILPRFNPGIARDFLSVGLESHPGDPALLETKARLQLLEDSPMEALATLEPLLEATRPPASVLALALQALLDQDAGGAEAFARKALSLHPQDRLLAALAQEVAGRTGPAMEAHLRAVEESRGPMATLEGQLWAMRAAIRLSAFEDALRLARLAQTRIGDPDPRCLDAIYESLSALEPGEPREDLAEMAQEARRRATRRKLSPEDRARAQLAAGFHLDPVLLGPLWDGLQARGPLDPLPAANPEPTRALLPIATGTGCAALFDVQGLAASMAKAPWDWLRDPELVAKAQESGHLVLAALPSERPSWLRVCSTPPRPAHRFSKGPELALKVSSGQVFAGPGEALLGSPGDAASPLGLAEELGGRLRLLPVGRYQVTIWRAEGGPWPGDEVGEDPADLVFQLGPPIK